MYSLLPTHQGHMSILLSIYVPPSITCPRDISSVAMSIINGRRTVFKVTVSPHLHMCALPRIGTIPDSTIQTPRAKRRLVLLLARSLVGPERWSRITMAVCRCAHDDKSSHVSKLSSILRNSYRRGSAASLRLAFLVSA
jgi:hypothetical protein